MAKFFFFHCSSIPFGRFSCIQKPKTASVPPLLPFILTDIQEKSKTKFLTKHFRVQKAQEKRRFLSYFAIQKPSLIA